MIIYKLFKIYIIFPYKISISKFYFIILLNANVRFTRNGNIVSY